MDEKLWRKQRTRVGVVETVTVAHVKGKNLGIPGEVKTDHLHCPCSICGHVYQWECEEESNRFRGGCDCCSGTCS